MLPGSTKVSSLSPLLSSEYTNNDLFYIVDVSAGSNGSKNTTLSQLSASIYENAAASINTQVYILSASVDTLFTNVNILSGNVYALSSTTTTLTNNVGILSSDVSNLYSYTATLSTNVNVLSSNLFALSSSVVTVTNNVSVLSSNVNNLYSYNNTLSTNVNSLSSNLYALSAKAITTFDTSIGGYGVNDSGKVPIFQSDGSLWGNQMGAYNDLIDTTRGGYLNPTGLVFFYNSGDLIINTPNNITQVINLFIPSTSGTFAITTNIDGIPDNLKVSDTKTTLVSNDSIFIKDSQVAGTPAKQISSDNFWLWAESRLNNGISISGNISAARIYTPQLDALSANITVIDIKQYELSGFNVIGNSTIQGNISASGTIAAGNMTLSGNQVATVVNPVRTTLSGNGTLSTFSISGASGIVNPSALIVAIDGALQEPIVDYTVASGQITFTSPLPNGSKAVVISPTNTLQVSQMIPADGSVTSSKLDNNIQIAGNLTVKGQMEASSSQAATNGTSVMTRDLADARYGPVYDVISQDQVSVTNSTDYVDVVSLVLPAGTYQIDAYIASGHGNTGGCKTELQFSQNVAASGMTNYGRNNTATSGLHVDSDAISSLTMSDTGATTYRVNYALISVLSSTTTVKWRYSQQVSNGTASVASKRAYIIARKIP